MELETGGLAALAAGFAMGIGAFAAAWSQGAIGAAMMGAIAERPELESKALIYLVLPEILAVLGFVVAFLLIQKA
ncbi:ATPase [Candidatus Micrarchaeota archaeon]|nr:ATPase [Candidatus Micrarchaeota archaeon]